MPARVQPPSPRTSRRHSHTRHTPVEVDARQPQTLSRTASIPCYPRQVHQRKRRPRPLVPRNDVPPPFYPSPPSLATRFSTARRLGRSSRPLSSLHSRRPSFLRPARAPVRFLFHVRPSAPSSITRIRGRLTANVFVDITGRARRYYPPADGWLASNTQRGESDSTRAASGLWLRRSLACRVFDRL